MSVTQGGAEYLRQTSLFSNVKSSDTRMYMCNKLSSFKVGLEQHFLQLTSTQTCFFLVLFLGTF